jgi:spermidine synthase
MNYFTFIADAVRDPAVKIGHRQGDGRILLQDAPEEPGYVGPFDLIVLDAFSSDAIPVHLLTKEAVEIYLRNIKDNGIIAFHISNRYFDLRRPLQRIAHELGLIVYVRDDNVATSDQMAEGKKESLWLTIVRKKEAMGALAKLPNWQLAPDESVFPLWTDDHANLLGALIGLARK